ncbi:hypothetical protein J7438_22095 [Thalassotalea sp. G20_0]|uniref:hypothetical protein n=1 Tax=Thalassotalea sp. G20_0 TaxID=2821093 RepID=UPI001ADCA933|nr:hypothetical protein [Thalassotalea sp. G20_0]MBO9496755.1 hypothetical protein [Thalassotalea sp. G20_0]
MSEYQYYELVAVDRQLSKDEMGYLRGISSRAQISPNRFCNTYNYGDLKADPRQLLSRFFDAFVVRWNDKKQKWVFIVTNH